MIRFRSIRITLAVNTCIIDTKMGMMGALLNNKAILKRPPAAPEKETEIGQYL